jgi:uncharacterized membrane protein
MKQLKAVAIGTLLTSLSAAAANALPVQPLPNSEKCYGVSFAGSNDCAAGAGTICAGTSSRNYEGGAWQYVPKGTCTTIKTPRGQGSLTPIRERR